LEEKTVTMTGDMEKFADLEKLKGEAEEFKHKLEADSVSYGARQTALRSHVTDKVGSCKSNPKH
jgi:hypothetical protein